MENKQPSITMHIKNIFGEGELIEDSVCKDFLHTAADRKIYTTKHYNLDLIISLGYRIRSDVATRFRQWATAIDYDPQASASLEFFKIVQNKLHFAAHGYTAAEVIYLRVDSDKPFAGLTNFKGKQPTQVEAMVAKNFLELSELKVLNNLVSAYFDLAEINALEQKPMKMADYIRELDNILKSTGRKLLSDAGKISHEKATEKATLEYRKYKAKSLSEVERSYLENINSLQRKVEKKVKQKAGNQSKIAAKFNK